jgi:RimJ/RimL family protein N-acetyltransferase
MQGGAGMVFSDSDIKKITEICSQSNTYESLFKERFEGKPYTEKDARDFISWVEDGWKNQTHFVFFIRKSNSEIIGAVDIKSADLNRAEVGYWADENHKGFMTSAVNELSVLAKEVGFSKLFAGVLKTNTKSIGVLERAGFQKIDEKKVFINEEDFEYEKEL